MNWGHQDTTGASIRRQSQGNGVMSVSHESHPPLSFLPSLQGDGRDDLGGCSLCLLSSFCDKGEWSAAKP